VLRKKLLDFFLRRGFLRVLWYHGVKFLVFHKFADDVYTSNELPGEEDLRESRP
jgi:hypothetical protein